MAGARSMKRVTPELRVLGDAEQVAEEAARHILAVAAHIVAMHGRFRLVLAGGATPLAAYRRLARAAADWPAWELYFGDERCLPVDHPQRNSRAAATAWLDLVPLAANRIHPIPAERGAELAALAYQGLVARAQPLDLVLLGMGEDGHTASLFPGQPIPADRLVIPVLEAPKPPPERVSLTPLAFAGAGGILVLITGAAKRLALQAWRDGADLPIARAAAMAPCLVLVDRAATGPLRGF